jgi:hypothetical protein
MAEALLRGLNGSSHLAIADQYLRGKRATTAFAGNIRDRSAPPSSAADSVMNNIGPVVCRALESIAVAPTIGDMVLVFGSSGITFPVGSRRVYCAWHSWATCQGTTVLVAFAPNPIGTAGCIDGGRVLKCNSASDAANSASSSLVQEFMEAVTDPYGTAWFDANEQEIADKCMDKLKRAACS